MSTRHTKQLTGILLLAAGLAVVGSCTCGPEGSSGPAGTTAAPTATTATARVAAKPSVLVAGPRPAVRDATVTATSSDGITAVARPMLSKVTPGDGVRLALRFAVAAPDAGSGAADAGTGRAVTMLRLGTTRVVVRKPDGAARTLELAFVNATANVPLGGNQVQELAIDGGGLTHWKEYAWKDPDAGLFAAPGPYTLRVEGQVEVDAAPLAFATGELPIEVVPAAPGFLPVADLRAAASNAVAAHARVAAPPPPRPAVIDDAADNRWVRFGIPSERGDYDVRIVDVLLSPAGKTLAMQDFVHFTCVAEGTRIATPRGDLPVEQLAPGDTLWGFDTARGTRVETTLTHVEQAVRTELVRIGGALLTPEHPVFADDRWTLAGDLAPGAALVDAEGRSRPLGAIAVVSRPAIVFDLSTTWPHDFFAGGVLVHNKARANELAPGDPWRGLFLRTTD